MRLPIFTLTLVAANVLAYRLESLSTCEEFGLVPSHFTHGGSLNPLVSSLFLHDPSALTHIAGNMVFLALFGTLVEGRLGHLGFLALYLTAGVAGGLMHVLVAPGSTDALVGASGAIFGVLAVAGALYPRLLGFVAAFAALNIWNALTGDSSGVSFGAHIGGFVAGFLVVALLRVTDSEALEAA